MASTQYFPAGINTSNYMANALLMELADLGLLINTSNGQPEQPKEGGKGTLKEGHLILLKAAIRGDWESAERFLKDEEDFRILNVAVSTGQSIQFVEKLVDKISKETLAKVRTRNGETPLHYAAIAGNTKAARILVQKDPFLTRRTNKSGSTPLHRAVQYGHKETTRYLLQVTLEEIQRVTLDQDPPSSFPRVNDPSPFEGERGVRLINRLITANFYDIALDVLTRYPKLAVGKDREGTTALATLAKKPQAFPSGSNYGFCKRLIYNFFAGSVNTQNVPRHVDEENPCGSSKECPKEPKVYGFLQNMHDEIMMHNHALQILEILISEAVKHSDEIGCDEHIGPALLIAAKFGIHEFVTEAIKDYPLSLWSFDPQGRNVFHFAIVNRQEKVFNLLYQLSSYKHLVTRFRDNDNNNMLHLAAIVAPSSRISGAALQMQRELQWFKEVEKVVQPAYKERENNDKKTPRELFTEEHKNLVEQGEKWMKDTAESCALVAALVLTVVFAAAFTVPGGSDQNGIPIFSKERSFMIFAISNAFALFSSATSLLMFLGILTSRYSEEDFLRALPMRLSIGLITLFFSIAAMLAAFSSALHILLSHQVSWIAVPIGLLACVPVTLFALLQFPLLVEIVSSTFGPSIFLKQNDEIIM